MTGGVSGAMEMTLPAGGTELIGAGAQWRFFRGTEFPGDGWYISTFSDETWEEGNAGFGYDDDDDATVLDDMEDSYVTVYIRREFSVESVPADAVVDLVIDYDDGFIAYVNGVNVASEEMPDGPVDHETEADGSHEAGTPERIRLGAASELLHAGMNLLAIEGHNTSLDSSDFSLHPRLETATDVVFESGRWVVTKQEVLVAGTTEASDAVLVQIAGSEVSVEPGTGAWESVVQLSEGLNHISADARNESGDVVDSGETTILYLSSENQLSGELTGDTTISGACVIVDDVVVPAGSVLTVTPGTVVMLQDETIVTVYGQLTADGTEDNPILFTRAAGGGSWGRILFFGAEDSSFSHCTIEYADCEGEHQDYYEEGSRDYHEAVVGVAAHLEFHHCTFHHLPDSGGGGEGDAIAIISDDPDFPGDASATVSGCRFLSIGQGVHGRFSYILVEDCFFTGKNGDNDDVDLWGESDPAPVIRNCVFLDPAHDDMINPTRCSAVIVGNIIAGSDDHGVVLRDKGTPLMINNLIYNCSSAGIAVENTCDALLVNNTIFDCGRGLRLLDLGRAGPPYYLTPGGGTATLVNCIIWNCSNPITVADSDNPDAEDQGSHVTVMYSDIEGGEGGVSVSGSASTVTWGEGNMDADPLFVDPDSGDFHLGQSSPLIDKGSSQSAPDVDFDGYLRPCGDGFDMGAFEFGSCSEETVLFRRGDANADDEIDLSDCITCLLYLFAGGSEPVCLKTADANDTGAVDISDAVYLLGYLFAQGAPPAAPFPECGVDATEDPLSCISYPPCE